MTETLNILNTLLRDDQTSIAERWIEAQLAAPGFRTDRTSRTEIGEYSRRFLTLLGRAVASGQRDLHAPAWAGTREFLEDLSVARAHQGFSPSETATFVFSLKAIVFDAIRARLGEDPDGAMSAIIDASQLLDALGLFTTEVFQRGREQVIVRQQQELLELSTPVVTLWDGILALPVIGTLDSARTQVVMESLLERIVSSGASIAIIDITGTSPCSVNLSAFEIRLRRICDTLASSVKSGGSWSAYSNTSATEPFSSSGRSMPRSAPKSVSTWNSDGRTAVLPASTFARSSRSFTSPDSWSAA
jgi:rsbT co-antagonist protein RsbR